MSLTVNQIKALQPESKPRRYVDGHGLYLEVSPQGGKLWRLKYRFLGKEKRLSIGIFPDVSLKEARDAAQAAKQLLSKGIDPSAAKRVSVESVAHVFRVVALEWFDKYHILWTGAHATKIKARLTDKIFPAIGDLPIDSISTGAVLSFCREIETEISPYMAHVLHGVISRIFRFAIACDYVASDPCRDLRGALTPHKEVKMPAITEPVRVGELAIKIDGYDGLITTRCAMQMLLLCMCRTQEIRGMRWAEIGEDGVWRIPAERMKMQREHLVPLSRQALGILAQLSPVTGEHELVFPSYCRGRKDSPLGKNTINNALRVMGYKSGEIVGHGFRSAASTILNELGWNPDAVEMQLSHAPSDKVRGAYNRAAYLDERRRMLQAWADHLDTLKEKAGRI
ncbi:MAG: integrase arm-type DNA-binding domain-containing protein [Desulfovibrio sp.]|uniref:tyrosine-type recombinase/integrase n=1 Tax=Desulfovibrio sp. TaxID=885 RepID=UPI002A36B3BD|nr:integrase arm-type DNA-binding domain-containing protein [Desulfovibrio sp.]MDY0258678.1 integrase arm-type DNA-binding domain-containing protein [Desulfovibrio sp.]